MDIYSFINSKDIAEHLRKLNYQFTTPETAFLVWKNRTMTLKEKHAVWEEIIRTMPNCSMPERPNMRAIEDFHEFLRTYMKMQDDLVQKVYAKENAVYFYDAHYADLTFCDEERAYSDIERCKKAIVTECPIKDCHIELVRLKKQMLDKPDEIYAIDYNEKFEIMGVDAEGIRGEWHDLLRHSFEDMSFSFPTPFKHGDIVVSRYSSFDRIYGEKSVFVLDSLATWDKKQTLENGFKKEECKHADKTLIQFSSGGDMCASGYFQNDDGTLYSWGVGTYLDLEYYRESLDGKKRILTALSMYMRGELDVVTLMNIYNSILQQEYAAGNIRVLDISDRTKKKIGLR